MLADGTMPDAARLTHAVASEGLGSEGSTSPLLLKATWSIPIEHWNGLTVSRRQDGRFVKDRALVKEGVAFLTSVTTRQTRDGEGHRGRRSSKHGS